MDLIEIGCPNGQILADELFADSLGRRRPSRRIAPGVTAHLVRVPVAYERARDQREVDYCIGSQEAVEVLQIAVQVAQGIGAAGLAAGVICAAAKRTKAGWLRVRGKRIPVDKAQLQALLEGSPQEP